MTGVQTFCSSDLVIVSLSGQTNLFWAAIWSMLLFGRRYVNFKFKKLSFMIFTAKIVAYSRSDLKAFIIFVKMKVTVEGAGVLFAVFGAGGAAWSERYSGGEGKCGEESRREGGERKRREEDREK